MEPGMILILIGALSIIIGGLMLAICITIKRRENCSLRNSEKKSRNETITNAAAAVTTKQTTYTT